MAPKNLSAFKAFCSIIGSKISPYLQGEWHSRGEGGRENRQHLKTGLVNNIPGPQERL